MYCWVERKSGKEIEVLRSFSDFEVPPTAEELAIINLVFENPEWERIIKSSPKIIRGDSWGPGKGHWVWLLIGAGACLLKNWLI